MFRRCLIIGAGGLAGAAAGIPVGWLGRGDWEWDILPIFMFAFIALPLGVAALIALGIAHIGWSRQGALRAATVMLAVAFGLFAFALVEVRVGHFIIGKDIMRARACCEALVPAVERFHRETGAWPEKIDAFLPEDEPLPRLIREHLGSSFGRPFYFHDNQTFYFSFLANDDMFGESHTYHGDTGVWDRIDGD